MSAARTQVSNTPKPVILNVSTITLVLGESVYAQQPTCISPTAPIANHTIQVGN